MAADTGPNCIDTLTMEDTERFTSADPQVDIRLPEETAPLIPVTNSSNRQRFCFFSDLYYSFLLAQGAMLILSITFFWISLQSGSEPCTSVNMMRFVKFSIAYDFFGTLNCIIFTAIVVKSQIFVGFSIVFRNLIHLPKFWTLVILFALYSLGALLTVINVLYLISQRKDLHCYLFCLEIVGISIEVIHSLFMTIFIGFLNYTNIRNVRRECTYVLLKIALVVFCSCFAISWLNFVFLTGFYLRYQQKFLEAIGQFLLLPFCQKVIELLWTKILHNEKRIIGKISSQNDENRHSSAI